jgi:hypothetical protein
MHSLIGHLLYVTLYILSNSNRDTLDIEAISTFNELSLHILYGILVRTTEVLNKFINKSKKVNKVDWSTSRSEICTVSSLIDYPE